jgi:hypothetical protein
VEGTNITLDFRFAADDVDRIRTAAVELLALGPDPELALRRGDDECAFILLGEFDFNRTNRLADISERRNAHHAIAEQPLPALAVEALAHRIDDAYARSDMFDKRRGLMQAWADFA